MVPVQPKDVVRQSIAAITLLAQRSRFAQMVSAFLPLPAHHGMRFWATRFETIS